MLKVLKRIVQDVTAAGSLDAALKILVQRVKKTVDAQVVSVFLLDAKSGKYMLAAYDGIAFTSKQPVRLKLDKGLIGLIGRREEPLNLDDAHLHPNFHRSKLFDEEHLHGFLGIPIIQHRKLMGVLTAQQEEKKFFDDAEEAFLITLAAQLGGIIAHAEATGELAFLTATKRALRKNKDSAASSNLQGIGAVPGIGIGTAVVIYPVADLDAVPKHPVEDIDAEIQTFDIALTQCRDDMKRLGRRMKQSVAAQEHALFDVYLKILEKNSLGQEVAAVIKEEKVSAQAALSQVIRKHVQQFEAMDDPYLRERASDFRDLGRRVLAKLQQHQKDDIDYPTHTILIGDEITAAALAEVPEGQLTGIISAKGSNNSHVSILARAMGVPTVTAVKGLTMDSLSGLKVVIDGYLGHIHINPGPSMLAEFKKLVKEEQELNQSLVSLREKPAQTPDQHTISLQVNTGLALDAGLSMTVGAQGVGLYRSEVIFMNRDCFPSEDEQTIIYHQVLKAFAPSPVTMRTLDIGGDKNLSYLPIEEDNPYLGWRGIRVTLDHPDVFLMQVRAMMRASENLNNLRIMLPMISSLEEVEEGAYLIAQAFEELLEEGCDIQMPKIGAMIEVPSAAFLSKELGKRVDFLSVGSNDLTQYILAVDRNNARVAGLYNPLHPAMLRTLIKIVEGGHAAGIEVSICGEMAADPLAVILLLAMGFDTLSMNSASLPRVKWVVRNIALSQARKILDEVLEMERSADIRLHLQTAIEDAGLGGLIRAGKS